VISDSRTKGPKTHFGQAQLKVEIPIKGVIVDIFEVEQGLGGNCFNEFNVGERWFFSGNRNGSSYFDGSTMLVNEFGAHRMTGVLGADHNEINRLIPKVLMLPAPAFVVREYQPANPAREPGNKK
jgi:hypothetical protein